MKHLQIDIPSLELLDQAANKLIQSLGTQKKLAISGEMGAGKTTIIQALCRQLGVTQVVTSPTFALINEYFTSSGDSVYHFDLYRIETVSELYDIGYEDYFYSDAWCFVEWPERAGSLIPGDFLRLHVTVHEDGIRSIEAIENTG